MIIHGEAKTILGAYVKARASIGATVRKDATGNHGSKYATLAAITEATSDTLANHGLAIVQESELHEGGVTVSTWMVHESGAMIEFVPLTMPLTDRKPQAVGSAITYARRYQLVSVCGLAPDDDDGQAAQDATKHAPAKPVPMAKPQAQHITKEQLDVLGEVGAKFYGDEWPEQLSRLVEAVTKGAADDVSQLLATEADKLIIGLRKKMAETMKVAA